MTDPRSLARHLRHCFEHDGPPRTGAGDAKLWFLALEHLIRHGALAAAAHAAPHLVAAFPGSLYIGRLAMLLDRMPPPVDDPPFAGFADDAEREMQVVRRAGATTALLVFCGRHGALGFPLPIAHRYFGPLGVHVVYLRDPRGELYGDGLPSLGDDRGATVRALRAVVDGLGATRIACYGNSNGGYAALLYGLEMGAAAVLAVNALTAVPDERVALHLGNDGRRPRPPDLARLYAAAPRRPRVRLVYGSGNAEDSVAAAALAGIAGVTAEAVPDSDGHDAHMALIEHGSFYGLLRCALLNGEAPDKGSIDTSAAKGGPVCLPKPNASPADPERALTPPTGNDALMFEAMWKEGSAFRDSGRSAEALDAFARAFEAGYRPLAFLRDYLNLVAGEARYAELLAAVETLRREGVEAAHPRAVRHLAMMSGHAKLALAHPCLHEIAAAEDRAASEAWLDASALRGTVAAAMRARQPFALIRVGDGEARYLLGEGVDGADGLEPEERRAMRDTMWENWFGEPSSEDQAEQRVHLLAAYEDAVRAADVVGACSPERLRRDTAHYGYLAWQERWLRRCLAERPDVRFTDALISRTLNAETPFLAALLEGQDVVGVISPHPGLGEALARHLGIGRVVTHVIPGEQRLPGAGGVPPREPHFPAVYERLLETLTIPRPGCVFLVAAGLLAKVYCARIKALGGIALDIGSLADAWAGVDTRNGWYAGTPTLDRDAPSPDPEYPAASTSWGALSIGKTGSMALAAALRGAGFQDAIHLHFLGPRAMALKGSEPEPMVRLAVRVAQNLSNPQNRFRFVTSVRDPIARILSNAFYTADSHKAATGVDITKDRDALIAWWDSRALARIPDLWATWFDDTYKATFGFDFREHAFDHARKSLRFASDRLRVVVLRQEDEPTAKAAELGWLVDRVNVEIPLVNTSVSQGYDEIYRPFLTSFVAPPHWLDGLYASAAIRHFYTEAERDAFRSRWSGGKRSYPVGTAGRSPPFHREKGAKPGRVR